MRVDRQRSRGPSVDWRLLSRQVRRDARARLGDEHNLEDLVQDAFVLLLEQSCGVGNPRAWIRSTVWRLLANRRRSGRITRRASVVEVDTPGETFDPALRIDLATEARRLKPADRLLLAALAAGLSHREIAERLGVGWKSVGSRILRLRAKLGHLARSGTSVRS